MPSLELNKIIVAVLATGLCFLLVKKLGDVLVAPKKLAQPVYTVDLSVLTNPAPTSSAALPSGGASTPSAAASAAPAALAPIAPLLATASAQAGEKLAKQCAACHSFVKGAPNRVGPNLWNVVERHRASSEGFSYSATLVGMKEAVWDYESINLFIANPKGFVAGTKMAFGGVKKPEERANLIAYLRSLSDEPKPLP